MQTPGDQLPMRGLQGTTAINRFLQEEQGSGTLSSFLWSVVLLMLGGVAIDGANAYTERNRLQAATDAAALAAAANLARPNEGKEIAIQTAQRNLGSASGAITVDDIHYVYFDPEGRSVSFVDYDNVSDVDNEPNAAMVVSHRTEGRGNSVSQFVLQLIGAPAWEMRAASVAVSAADGGSWTDDCLGGLILSTGRLNLNGSSDHAGPLCLHGELGVTGGGSNTFTYDVAISAADINNITASWSGSSEATVPEISIQRSADLTIARDVYYYFDVLTAALDASENQPYYGPILPAMFHGYNVVHLDDHASYTFVANNATKSWEVVPQARTIYYVEGNAVFKEDMQKQEVVIVAEGEIKATGGPNLYFEDVYFFGGEKIQLAGNIDWGNYQEFCDTGVYTSYMLSTEQVHFGGGSGAYGLLVAAPTVRFGGSFTGLGGLYVEADTQWDAEANTLDDGTTITNTNGNSHVDTWCEQPLESDVYDTVKFYKWTAGTERTVRLVQ